MMSKSTDTRWEVMNHLQDNIEETQHRGYCAGTIPVNRACPGAIDVKKLDTTKIKPKRKRKRH